MPTTGDSETGEVLLGLNGTYSDLMVFQWGLMELKIVIEWIMNGIYPPVM